MASSSAARLDTPVTQRPVAARDQLRVLRWRYRRDGEELECQLALTRDLSAYELRVQPPRFAVAPASQLFDDALGAFERHARIERVLISDGWHLDAFEHGYL